MIGSRKKIIVKTERLVVRPLYSTDYDVWKTSVSSVKRSKNKWDHILPSEEQTKRAFHKQINFCEQHRKKDIGYYFFVFEKLTGAYVGTVRVNHLDRRFRCSCNLSFSFVSTYWGKGYASESIEAVIPLIFKEINIHRIEALIEPNNRRAINLVKSFGMRHEGLCKRLVRAGEDWKDMSVFALTSEEMRLKWNE